MQSVKSRSRVASLVFGVAHRFSHWIAVCKRGLAQFGARKEYICFNPGARVQWTQDLRSASLGTLVYADLAPSHQSGGKQGCTNA